MAGLEEKYLNYNGIKTLYDQTFLLRFPAVSCIDVGSVHGLRHIISLQNTSWCHQDAAVRAEAESAEECLQRVIVEEAHRLASQRM